MKLTRDRLKQIIKEELNHILQEQQEFNLDNFKGNIADFYNQVWKAAKPFFDGQAETAPVIIARDEEKKRAFNDHSSKINGGPGGLEISVSGDLQGSLGVQPPAKAAVAKPPQQALPPGSFKKPPPRVPPKTGTQPPSSVTPPPFDPNKVGNNKPQLLRAYQGQLASLQKTEPNSPKIAALRKKIAALGG